MQRNTLSTVPLLLSLYVIRTDRETPLYTLELKNDRIIQLKGERNKAADEEAKKEAEQFLAHCGKLKIEF